MHFDRKYVLVLLKKLVHIFNMNINSNLRVALQESILRRIRAKGASWAFTPSDFADLGDPRSVGMVLTRLNRAGKIRRVHRGIYDVLHDHPLLGRVGTGADAVVQAIARRDGLKLLPSGAHAANAMGLSTQVAARSAYGIAGRSRIQPAHGKSQIIFRHRSPKAMAMAGRSSGWVAEALRSIGKKNLTPDRLQGLKASLGPKQRRELLTDIRYAPAWMRPIFKDLAQHG